MVARRTRHRRRAATGTGVCTYVGRGDRSMARTRGAAPLGRERARSVDETLTVLTLNGALPRVR